MALPIHTLDRIATHTPRLPATFFANPGKGTSSSNAPAQTPQTSEAPSFAAAFVQATVAAAAAASTGPAAATTPTTPAAATAPNSTDADDPAGPLFGANPWMADPTGYGPNGTVTHYNPVYFATPQTAQVVAQMLGGSVVQSTQITTAPGSPFQQNESNYMVQLPNGGMVNPGFIADLYTHGWNQTFINQQIANEVAGAQPTVNT